MSEQIEALKPHRMFPPVVALAATVALAGCNVGEMNHKDAERRLSTSSEAPMVQALPELTQPGAVIDLSTVSGTEQILLPDPSAPKRLAAKIKFDQFGVIEPTDGGSKIRIDDDSGITPRAKGQLTRLITDNKPLLEAAFDANELSAVHLTITNGDFDPYFDATTKSINYVLPKYDGRVTESQFRYILTHETVHALISPIVRGESSISARDEKLVKSACTALSKEAFGQYEDQLRLHIESLDALIKQSSGDEHKVFKALKKRAEAGTIDEVAVKANRPLDMLNVQCNIGSYSDMVIAVARDAGVADSEAFYDTLDRAYGDGTNNDYNVVIDSWINAVDNRSLFNLLNESSYIDTAAVDKENIGHGEDGADEMIASVTSVTLNNPEGVKKLLKSLSPEDQKTVQSAIKAAYAVISSGHETLAPFLAQWQKQFGVQ